MKLIDAVYVNVGGGKKLLDVLLKQFQGRNDIKFLLDERLKEESTPWNNARIHGSELDRLRFYKRHKNEFTKVFCFGNVPPPINLSCPVKTYLHNRLFISPPPLTAPQFSGIKARLKCAYIRRIKKNTDTFVVQTKGMAKETAQALNISEDKVEIWPFYESGAYERLQSSSKDRNAFGYVSLPHLHKGHECLLSAWKILATQGLTPELHLTIPFENPLCRRIEALRNEGLNIINHGFCNPSGIYSHCQFQIYPSATESFGLGLIEAVEAGCDIISPDLSYVYDVIQPSLTWQHGSAQAIAQAVQKCLTTDLPHSRMVVQNKLTEIIHYLS